MKNTEEVIFEGYPKRTLESESTAQEPALVELTTQDISEGKGVGVDPKLIRIKE